MLGGAAAVAGAAIVPEAAEAVDPKKPNIVFILADDLGAFDLSCYGRRDYSTPRIDSLARDGMQFGFAYSSSASCTPTRVGLFSGRYPNRVPIGTVEGGGATSDTIGYSSKWPSLARTLHDAGYRTALIGKWNLGPLPNFGPNQSGYDEFFGFTGGAIDYWSHDIGSAFDLSPGRNPDLYEDDKPVKVEGYATDLFTERACAFIARNARRPFLLSLHYNAPHWPWQTRTDRGHPRSTDGHFDGGSMAVYAEMMQALDDGVGRVLDTLKAHGLERDTLVVFTSDNGGERFGYQWPLKGEKGDLWEGGVRVPLLVRWPSEIMSATATDQVTLSMDWFPTFAKLTGAATDPKAPPDGIDISPQLRGAGPVDRMVFWKTPNAQSALEFPWKYLKEQEREHLFNLQADVSENANYKLKQPAIFLRLKEASVAWASNMLPSAAPRNPGRMDLIRALDFPSR